MAPISRFSDGTNLSFDLDDDIVPLREYVEQPEFTIPAVFERRARSYSEVADRDRPPPPLYRATDASWRGNQTGAELLDRPPQGFAMQDLPPRSEQPNRSMPPPEYPQTPPNPFLRERSSLEPLPRWQPDHEVNACPVCNTQFSFFFRKHHCRKCGRVVCNSCSPHRITIPRQYVVQPPSCDDQEVSEAYPARNLGGGEVVRVCNPCVPDPWTPERARESINSAPQAQGTRGSNGQSQRQHPFQSSPNLPPPRYARPRAHTHQPIPYGRAVPSPQRPSFSGRPISGQNLASASSSSPNRPIRHRYTASSSNAPPSYQTYDTRVRPLSAASSAQQPAPQPRQRREVREEDECPVCGEELPPGDDIRKSHIEECISTRFGTPNNAPSSMPNRSNSTLDPSTPPSSRPRASTYRPRGMAVYKATEKDCTDADGNAPECVICFEEFQPGDEMGRMECLCKFHRGCIRRWWETKGAGSCPTHQLQQD